LLCDVFTVIHTYIEIAWLSLVVFVYSKYYCMHAIVIQVRENWKEDKIIKKRKRLSNGLDDIRVKKRPPG